MDIVTLLEQLMAGIFDAEKKYLNNPKDFYTLETSVKSTTDAFAASFLGIILTSMNKAICDSGWREVTIHVNEQEKGCL